MSSDPVFIGHGIDVSTYAGPDHKDGGSRRRYQLSVRHPDTGQHQVVQLDSNQLDALRSYLNYE